MDSAVNRGRPPCVSDTPLSSARPSSVQRRERTDSSPSSNVAVLDRINCRARSWPQSDWATTSAPATAAARITIATPVHRITRGRRIVSPSKRMTQAEMEAPPPPFEPAVDHQAGNAVELPADVRAHHAKGRQPPDSWTGVHPQVLEGDI